MRNVKKKSLKRIIIILINIVLLFGFYSTSFGYVLNPNRYNPKSEDNVIDADKLKDIGNILIGYLQAIGSVVSVVVLIVLGIKYMIGSAEEKAEYKKTMMPYLIGAIMVFAITNILGIIANIVQSF